MNNKYIQIQTTADSQEESEKIASILLENRACACVQIVPNIQSHYWWKEQIENSREFLLLIKTTETKYSEVEKLILKNHSYETPEIISIELCNISTDYAEWLEENLDGE